jgi:hypothetical protein
VEKRKEEIQKRKTGGSVRGRKGKKRKKKRRRGSRSTQFLHSL